MNSPGWQLTNLVALGPSEQDAVHRLAGDMESADGAEPLNEQALLRLPSSELGLTHIVATGSSSASVVTVGYAQVDVAGDGPASAEILVGPVSDRAGLATELLVTAEQLTAPDPLLVWTRGRSPVGPAALDRGYTASRELMTMRRSLTGVPADRVWPPAGVTVRTFVPGQDDEAWLAVNAAAFAAHPEQGAWTAVDLADRLAQPWFDRADFFLAHDADGTLLGFHWTKLHPPVIAGEPPLGEVYVLGVSPLAQGRGLGKVLLDVGLRHLAAGPARDVHLYVEAANDSAVRLYLHRGFSIDRHDIQYRSVGQPHSAPASAPTPAAG